MPVDSDTRSQLEFQGPNFISDAGLIAYRELEGALELAPAVENAELQDSRTGNHTRHTLTALLWQSVYRPLAGYEDTNDAEWLLVDPALRHLVGGRATDKTAVSTSQVARVATDILSTSENIGTLMDLAGQWIDQVRRCQPMKEIILDLDSSVSPTHGIRKEPHCNGHFGCRCLPSLVLFQPVRCSGLGAVAGQGTSTVPMTENCPRTDCGSLLGREAAVILP